MQTAQSQVDLVPRRRLEWLVLLARTRIAQISSKLLPVRALTSKIPESDAHNIASNSPALQWDQSKTALGAPSEIWPCWVMLEKREFGQPGGATVFHIPHFSPEYVVQ